MARTFYRSIVPINTPARKAAAYAKVPDLFSHAPIFGVDVLRVEYDDATQYLLIDTSGPLPDGQLTHLGLEAL